MKIGIDASRAFIAKRTGIEEYSYQLIKHLMDKLEGHEVVLYVSTNYELNTNLRITNIEDDVRLEFSLPENWSVKVIKFPYFWTQLGLSLEMLLHPVDVLFIPAHTVPLIHPVRTVVTIHGLEYEFCPEAYSSWERFYMRLSIKNSCRWARTIIAVSENTKKDLMNLYKVPEEKIEVVYEGYNRNFQFPISNFQTNSNVQTLNSKPLLPSGEDARRAGEGALRKGSDCENIKFCDFKNEPPLPASPPRGERGQGKYLLFIGRLEERKNIIGIIKAFEILKEHYGVPHKLILAGRFGYGAEKIKEELKNTNCGQDIILRGYVKEEEKWELLKKADVFLFPTFYEGFGIPVLEAQSMGVPVVAGNNSSIPEIVSMNPPLPSGEDARRAGEGALQKGNNCESIKPCDSKREPSPQPSPARGGGNHSALLVDPMNAEEIADAVHKLISDEGLKNAIIKQGHENVKRFSWDKCGKQIAQALIK